MREIILSQGKVALVDDKDFDWLSQHKWYAHFNKGNWYAQRNIQLPTGGRTILKMHRAILALQFGQETKGDHKDGDGLNNRRYNLRPCTNAQNCFNARPKTVRNKRSRFKGVTYRPMGIRRWRAYISFFGKPTTIGDFLNEEIAALAYNEAARNHFGQFARLNFVGL